MFALLYDDLRVLYCPSCPDCGHNKEPDREDSDIEYDFMTADLRYRHPVHDIRVKTVAGARKPRLFQPALQENDIVDPPTFPSVKWRTTDVGSDLTALRASYAYLTYEDHYLYARSEECVWAIQNRKKKGNATEILARLSEEVVMEEETLVTVFNMFRAPEDEFLRFNELSYMLNYFGLPSDKVCTQKFIDVADSDRDYRINQTEFNAFVGRRGGTVKIFQPRMSALRKAEPQRRGLLATDESFKKAFQLVHRLQEIGFEEHEAVYWRMLLPLSEIHAVSQLKKCQKLALTKIRQVAKKNNQKATMKMQWRIKELGIEKRDLQATLAWIREKAPIIIQIDIDKMITALNTDTHYRNQFETGCSGGLENIEARTKWEHDLFLGAYDTQDVEPFDRVKYGVINVTYDYRGVAGTEKYGDSYLILRDVRLRTTFAPMDSANQKSDKLAVLDYFQHQFMDYTDEELKEVVKVATSNDPIVGNSCVTHFLKYKEAQIHGEVNLSKHVERLVVHDRHKESSYLPGFLAEVCAKHGFELCWMSDEKKRMKQAYSQHLDPNVWEEQMDALSKPPEVVFRY